MKNLFALIALCLSFSVYGHGYVGFNFDSHGRVSGKLGGIITVSFLVFVLYIAFRVWRSLKKDKENEKNKLT